MSKAPHVVVAPDEIDPDTVHLLVESLEMAPPTAVVEVDCSAVTFMDSAGVRALSMAAQRQEAGGGGLRVVRPTQVVCRILEITALDGLISGAGAEPPST